MLSVVLVRVLLPVAFFSEGWTTTTETTSKMWIESVKVKHVVDPHSGPPYLGMLGIVAKAVVCVQHAGEDHWRLHTFTSAGLWGVEDAGKYLDEIDNEQLEDLKEVLADFGVDVSGFDTMALAAEVC